MILAIDPGNTDSGFALIDAETYKPIIVDKFCNDAVIRMIRGHIFDYLAIEMVQSFGMSVGAEVFETCVWIGRFQQCHVDRFVAYPALAGPCELVYRLAVKMHHCHTASAKDGNIAQALIDRFAPGEPNRGKGTKAAPGWFYGFSGDMWQAYALAVYVADHLAERAA